SVVCHAIPLSHVVADRDIAGDVCVCALTVLQCVTSAPSSTRRWGGRLGGLSLQRFRGLGRLRLARDVDQPRIGPLNGSNVGENLAAIPAAFVAALFETLWWQATQFGSDLVAARAELVQ